MIVVKIELWPMGVESSAREIGRTYIANDGHGTADRGDYNVAVCRRNTDAVPREIYPDGHPTNQPRAARVGQVRDYPRLAYNVWRLIARALLAAFPEEVPKGKQPKGEPVIDEQVMAGLALLSEVDELQPAPTDAADEDAKVAAAIEWLSHGLGAM